MPDVLSLAEKSIGLVNVNPMSLCSDGQLLRLYLKLSLRRYALLVGASVCITPLIHAVSYRLTLSQKATIRNFLDAEDGKTSSSDVRVVYEHPRIHDDVLKSRVNHLSSAYSNRYPLSLFSRIRFLCSPGVLFSSIYKVMDEGKRAISSCRSIICRGAAVIACGGSGGKMMAQDFSNRVVSYTLTYLVQYATTRWVISSMVQVLFYSICLALDRALRAAPSSGSFWSFQPLQGGWDEKRSSSTPSYCQRSGENRSSTTSATGSTAFSLSGVYQLGDFSFSTMGFITRSSGRWLRGVMMSVKMFVTPHSNFFWMNPQCADSIWCQLTPAGFVLSTSLAVLPSILHVFCTGTLRTILFMHKRSKVISHTTSPSSAKFGLSLPSFHWEEARIDQSCRDIGNSGKWGGVGGGTITVGKLTTKRQFWKSTKKYLINYHFLGAPLLAFLAANYAWKTQHFDFFQHTSGGTYETVSAALFIWSLFTFLISASEAPIGVLLH